MDFGVVASDIYKTRIPRSTNRSTNPDASRPNARMIAVRRFALGIIVALLTFSASGVSSLVISEPCTGYEQPGQEDGACAPTCVTCGCCAQAAEPAVLPVTTSLEAPVTDVCPLIPRLPKANPSDVLHVPKLQTA